MRFSMRIPFLSLVLASGIFLSACGDEHLKNREAYELEMKNLDTPVAIDPTKLDNLWAISGVGTYCKDKLDPRYDAYIYEKRESPEIFLFIKNGKFLRARLKRVCGDVKGEPTSPWLMDALNAEKPEESRSQKPAELLNSVFNDEKIKEQWHPFTLSNQTIATVSKSMRNAAEAPEPGIETRVLFLKNDGDVKTDALHVAYIDHKYPKDAQGVHTKKETFRSISGGELTKLLHDTHLVLKECPKPAK